MSTAAPPHRPCAALEQQSEGLDDDAVHRFLLGQDNSPQKLRQQEASSELGDPFAQHLLLEGVFPRTAGEVLSALEQAVTADDPLRTQRFFLVGEGSQIADMPGSPVNRNLRFLVTCGSGQGGPDIMVSAFHPDEGTAEVMAWDRRTGGFNFYRTVGSSSAWVFAGNSRHALTAPTRDNGPFESHKSGHFIMKELRFPWVHWDSPAAKVSPSVFTAQNLDDHPWVRRLEPGGAYTLEDEVAIPSIQRWTQTRLDALLSGTSQETPKRLLEQLLDTPTVNLMSSITSSAAAITGSEPKVDLPDTFFVDSAGLVKVGLQPPTPLFVASEVYARSLQTFEVTLRDDEQFNRPGDTHFAFVVPERAFEDTETIAQAIDRDILSKRLVASLLMVDFPNPVFSARRRQLLQHVPEIADTADFSEQVADAILATPEASQAGTAENEFAERWNVGEAFKDTFEGLLERYYSDVSAKLETQEGFDDYMRLAESRRERVRQMPIAESKLLFAHTTLTLSGPTTMLMPDRLMRPDGTVEEV
jgi:hypothetical protein